MRSGDKALSPRENIQGILNRSRQFIDSFDISPGRNLLITGPTGVGKTFLTHCIAAELLQQGKSVIYLTAYQFLNSWPIIPSGAVRRIPTPFPSS